MKGRSLAGLAAAVCLWSGAALGSDRCPVPPGAEPSAAGLQRTRMMLQAGLPLTVVALGSSSTQGTGASSAQATYPAQLDLILSQRHPGQRIEVLNKGIGGESAGANLVRFAADVLSVRPDLVVWQIGTNDRFQNLPLADFAATVRDGVAQLRAAGIDVIFMNPQSFPDEARFPGYAAYAASVVDLGRELGVPVLDRYGIMKWWLESGRFPAETILSPDGLHLRDASYRCLAEFVADMIDVQQPGPTATAAR
ncbi:SGNH/GDSL hydrolase family protein [Azospirillum thermophilum]|uniref:Lipolytic protein G-D-S-L family n=1 Tax=Azospirillum thermophilum TaxID=2202148 RepID=A0A2S2CQA4_9PROT|nr:SGNH/GDSL hydrolase family protein [Azospirillum thermophilum]AWK86497.1 lipolytic protein G-D-S-L family [Azospirillum thermophilum]